MSIPTHEDAHLMIELFGLRLNPLLQEADMWFNTQFQPGSWEEIKARYPKESREWRLLNLVLGYWEMIGALVEQNLLSEDLLFDAIESVDLTWDRVKEWLPSARSEMGADLWENIEIMVNRQQKWRNVRVRKALRI